MPYALAPRPPPPAPPPPQSPLAQVLVARNSELATAERQLAAARADVEAARQDNTAALETMERRHRAELAREAAEREKLRRRELQLEVTQRTGGWEGLRAQGSRERWLCGCRMLRDAPWLGISAASLNLPCLLPHHLAVREGQPVEAHR